MAQLHTERRLSEACTTPTSENLRTFEQVIQSEEAVWLSSPIKKNHEQEDDGITPTKKSVLTKVKEKAKKLRSSLSGKKLDQQELPKYNTKTPPWGVTLDDDEDDASPENHRTPTYESEVGHDNYKNASNKHKRESPVAFKKHVLESKNESPLGFNKLLNKFATEKSSTPKTKATLDNESYVLSESDRSVIVGDRPYSISPKIAGTGSNGGLDVASPGAYSTSPRIAGTRSNGVASPGAYSTSPRIAGTGSNGSLAVASPQAIDRSVFFGDRAIDTGNIDDGEIIEHRTNMSPQTTDKGVSMKAYFLKKFEPGKDERSLSQVISNAISPRKSSTDDTSVKGKMKDAVNSLLRPEQEPLKSSPNSPAAYRKYSNKSKNSTSMLPDNLPPQIKTSSSLRIFKKLVDSPKTDSSLHGQLFVNPYEVVEEGKHERRLQIN